MNYATSFFLSLVLSQNLGFSQQTMMTNNRYRPASTTAKTGTPNVKMESLADKTATVRAIMLRLAKAHDIKIDTPWVNILQNKQRGALVSIDTPSLHRKENKKDTSVLYMDEALYDLCRKTYKDEALFKAALAYFIAHELVHYYDHRGKKCGRDFFAFCKDPDGIKLEEYADRKGFWLALEAGFEKITDVASTILGLVYDDYQIAERSTNEYRYPTKAERRDMAEKQKREAQKLFQTFRKAKLAFLFEEYAIATALFKEMLQKVQHDEVLNNYAVAEINQVLKDMKDLDATDKMRRFAYFRYPLEINAYSRLNNLKSNKSSTENSDAKVLRQRLKEALAALKKVKYQDDAVKRNQITALILLGDTDGLTKADELINQLKTEKSLCNKADLLRGIVALRQDKRGEATSFFDKISRCQEDDFVYNICIFKSIFALQQTESECPIKDRAQGVSRKIQAPSKSYTDFLKENGIRYFKINFLDYAFSDSMPLETVKIGKKLSELPKEWRKPSRRVQVREGDVVYHCFDEFNAILAIRNDIVIGWMVRTPTYIDK